MKQFKYIFVNSLSLLRLVCSAFALILLTYPTINYLIIYFLLGLSDVIDGFLARKWQVESPLGATLDSLADVSFYLFICVTYFKLNLVAHHYVIFALLLIIFIKLISAIYGWIKFKRISFIHTFTNKFVGVLIFSYPLIYFILKLRTPLFSIPILLMAITAALEELYLIIRLKDLDSNHQGFISSFIKNKF